MREKKSVSERTSARDGDGIEDLALTQEDAH